MNLGLSMGEMRLRIYQLEDELAALRAGTPKLTRVDRHGLLPPVHEIPRPTNARPAPEPRDEPATRNHEAPTPPSRGGNNRGVGKHIHDLIPDFPPGETVAEIAAIAGVKSKDVSAWVHHFDDIERTGKRMSYRYYRKAAA